VGEELIVWFEFLASGCIEKSNGSINPNDFSLAQLAQPLPNWVELVSLVGGAVGR
jgi:hypothetical protein